MNGETYLWRTKIKREQVYNILSLVYNIHINAFLGGNLMVNKDINLYDIFINYSYSQLKELFKNAKTKEEQDFYMTLSNLVLQKEQAKVIGK